MRVVLTIIVLALFSSSTLALADYDTALEVKKHTDQYMVSAILKLHGTDATIRLVHMIEKADNKDQAVGLAFSKIRKEFANYSVIDSIATVITKDKSSDCTYF